MSSVQPYQQGEPVEYKSSTGPWKPATYMSDNNDGTHLIHFPYPHQRHPLKMRTSDASLRRPNGSDEDTSEPVQTNAVPESEEEEEGSSYFVFDTDGAYPMMDENHMTDHEIEERTVWVMGSGGVWVEASVASLVEEDSDEEDSDEEDSDEEEGMSNEERKELCSKGLEIIETVMEKDDQRLCEGDFVNLCNLLKELHKK